MDVILHCGAHRCATTSFQTYLRDNLETLGTQGVGVWGPRRTRNGLLDGLARRPRTRALGIRARGRVRLNLDMSARRGVDTLVVSDENMIGSMRAALQAEKLYPFIGERMARIYDAFGPVTRVSLQIRSLDHWWASALSFLIARGVALPERAALTTIAAQDRSWRHVISDLACACPGAEICVTTFENFADLPDELFTALTGLRDAPPVENGAPWRNRSPDLDALRRILAERGEDPGRLPRGTQRWAPFTPPQAAALREAYADDLFWLRAGADGLAILKEVAEPTRPGIDLAPALLARGQHDDGFSRRLAPTR